MPVTILEIAKMSGVSRSTVSRVINNASNVDPATRERVLQAIRDTHYRPSSAARSLVGAKTNILALVIPLENTALFTDPFYPLLIHGVCAACNQAGYHLMLRLSGAGVGFSPEPTIHNKLVSGVITASMAGVEEIISAAEEAGIPFVEIGRRFAEEEAHVSFVDVDNRAAARMAVEYLISKGRRRVAAISGPLNAFAGRERLAGYREALMANGLPTPDELVTQGDFTEASGYAGMCSLLRHHPDAVFAASDLMALGAIRALNEAGLNIPVDVSVVGFDNQPFSASSAPPLTTVSQPVYQMGETAARLLIDLIETGKTQPARVFLPTEMILRET